MLLVWRGSETSHHLGEEVQNFIALYRAFWPFPELIQPQDSSIIDCNHGKRCPWMFGTSSCQLLFHPQLPHIVLSSAAQEAAKLSEFDLTSYVPQQLHIFARSLYNIIMLQNNQTKISNFYLN